MIYRPGSSPASECFFDELSDVLERVSTYVNLIIIGDINLHLDSTTDALTEKFLRLLAVYNLRQHVSEPTHQHGHTLDVIITRDEQKIESISVDPQTLSDHSTIVATLARALHTVTSVFAVCVAAGDNWTLTVSVAICSSPLSSSIHPSTSMISSRAMTMSSVCC